MKDFACGIPWSYKWYWMPGIELLVGLLGALIVISPWALLVMAVVCYKKVLRLQAYVSSALFIWAVLTELFAILFYLILEHPPLHF
jgi:glycerol-3-phosphate acyltransferase PlsY